ncbi:HNH endonuclease signature motif containing protein [Steroidobacter sp.]|uniref:HNH endonuclease signature motif containing protein n=1 Tax=Steroidobacter sp. TaxID=1978227 RepID=UPI0039C8F6DE
MPGCPNTKYLDGHHIKHWAHGGETKLSNLVSLCRHHHRQVHEGNIVVQVLDDGAIRFTTPNGKSFDSTLCMAASDPSGRLAGDTRPL